MLYYVGTLIKWLLLSLLIIIVSYCTWVLIAFRDIPVQQLEKQYGGGNLQRVVIDGVDLRYKVEGQGPALVLIHSHFYSMRQWQPWVDTLSNDFTVIRYDLTSHGLTGPDPSDDYSRARGASLLTKLLAQLNIHQAHIVGSSTGGGIAYHFAANHPDKTLSLTLINTPGMPKVANKYMDTELPSWGGYLLYLLPESLFKPFLQAPVIDKSLIDDAMVEEFHHMYRREGNRLAEYRRLQQYDKSDVTPLLKNITAPTLLMWGADNPQLPVAHVSEFAEKLVNTKTLERIIYPETGHVIPLERPYRSAKDTKAFIDRVTGRL
ncbi:alpha/beta fold hydrolase [Thalassotalea maritima]|uniref:alpha/beta fold hydrolase n=1 Tax=Thalassotalea maritima TaxID=3242416 RepID=UPI0035288195